MHALLIALCLPLLTCQPTLEEQIQRKKDEIRELDLARQAQNFEYVEQIRRDAFERSQMRQRGIKLPDDSEVRRAAEKIHREALADIDRHRPIAAHQLRVLECELEERDRPKVAVKPDRETAPKPMRKLVPADFGPDIPPAPARNQDTARDSAEPTSSLIPVDFEAELKSDPWERFFANAPPSCSEVLRKERAK